MGHNGSLHTKIAAKFSSWKEALHQTCIRSSRVPPKVVAERLGISPSTLAHACDEHLPDNLSSKHLPALVSIPEIDLACLDHLEELAGRVAFVVPESTGTECSTRMTAELMHRTANILETKARAIEDGTWTPEEARDFRRKADDFTRCVQAIASYAERVASLQPERKALAS